MDTPPFLFAYTIGVDDYSVVIYRFIDLFHSHKHLVNTSVIVIGCQLIA